MFTAFVNDTEDIAFPFFVVEAKSFSGTIIEAENEMAGAMGKMLNILQRAGGDCARLPVLGITSIGSILTLWISFTATLRDDDDNDDDNKGYHGGDDGNHEVTSLHSYTNSRRFCYAYGTVAWSSHGRLLNL